MCSIGFKRQCYYVCLAHLVWHCIFANTATVVIQRNPNLKHTRISSTSQHYNVLLYKNIQCWTIIPDINNKLIFFLKKLSTKANNLQVSCTDNWAIFGIKYSQHDIFSDKLQIICYNHMLANLSERCYEAGTDTSCLCSGLANHPLQFKNVVSNLRSELTQSWCLVRQSVSTSDRFVHITACRINCHQQPTAIYYINKTRDK